MNTNREREELKKRLQSKEHRDAFVSACVDQTIPFQIRALRLAKERNWTQEDLAKRAGMKQERISACENPHYGKFNIRTLKQLAAAFDVGLIVRFAPFSKLVEWEANMSTESLEVPSFEKEDYFKEELNGDKISAQIILNAPPQPVHRADRYPAGDNPQNITKDPAKLYGGQGKGILVNTGGMR